MSDEEKIVAAEEEEEDLPAFDPSMKKKKKKKAVAVVVEEEAKEEEEEEEALDFSKKKKKKKTTSNAPVQAPVASANEVENEEYGYDFLISRIFQLLQESNPEAGSRQEDQRIKIPPPLVGKEGTRKTVWTNFADICDKMGRKHEHVMQYALAEMGTTGSLDAEKQFIIKGRFQ